MIGIKLDNRTTLVITSFQQASNAYGAMAEYISIYQDRCLFVGLADQGKDIVFRFIIEYGSLRDFGPLVVGLFSYKDF